MSAKSTLLDAILKADGKELAIIDEQIEEKMVDLRAKQAEIDKLKALRKTVNVLINGKPERKKHEKKAKTSPPPIWAGNLSWSQRTTGGRRKVSRQARGEQAFVNCC
jgi:hypothetical protein